MILGLSSYTYGWAIGVPGHRPASPMTELDLLACARQHGLRLLQICDNLPLNRLPPERAARFATLAREAGIQLEVGSRGLTLEHVAEMAALARRMEARLIRFVVDAPGFQPAPGEVVKTLRATLPLLEGLQLGLENHDRFTASTLKAMLEDVASDRIGICLDTANSLGAGEGLASVVAELAPFTVNLHLKDFQIERWPHLMGFTIEGRPAGAGMLNVPWLLEQLAPFRRCATAVLELWTPPEADLDRTVAKESSWVGQSLAYLRPLFTNTA